MTKPKEPHLLKVKRQPSSVVRAELPGRILSSLTREPMRSAQALAAELGFSYNTVLNKLREMEANGKTTSIEIVGAIQSARVMVWSVSQGVKPEPVVVTPIPCHPFAALFGPAPSMMKEH